MYSFLDGIYRRVRIALSPVGAAFVFGLVLFGLAALHLRPATFTSSLGVEYAALASNPFAADAPGVGYRILTPLLSYLLGLRGDLIIVTNLILCALFLMLVVAYFSRGDRPADGLTAGLVFAFSLVVGTTMYFGGYCDILTYILVFLMWKYRTHRLRFYLLLFLATMNHESVLFLVPMFAWLALRDFGDRKRWALDHLLGLGLVLGVMFGVRTLLSDNIADGLEASRYMEPLKHDPFFWFRQSSPNQLAGLLSVFKLSWLFVFVAGGMMWHMGRRFEVVAIALALFAGFGQLFVAYDASRLFTLSFPAMLIALEFLFANDPDKNRQWMGYVLLLTAIVPTYFTAAEHIILLKSAVTLWLAG